MEAILQYEVSLCDSDIIIKTLIEKESVRDIGQTGNPGIVSSVLT